MSRPLIPNKVKKEFKRITQQVVTDLSQPLVVVQESPMFVDCPNCIWDSINKKSSNVFDSSFTVATIIFVGTDQQRTVDPISFTSGRCPVCIGEGQLFTNKEVCIPAMINFIGPGASGGGFEDMAAGKEGVSFAVVKTLACHYDLLARNKVFVIHNNIKCEKFRPPFVRGLGGEEAVTEMVIQTTEAGQLASGKFDSGDHPFASRTEDPRRRIKGPTAIQTLRGQIRGQ
jgi:hypothetical protein